MSRHSQSQDDLKNTGSLAATRKRMQEIKNVSMPNAVQNYENDDDDDDDDETECITFTAAVDDITLSPEKVNNGILSISI